MLCKNKDIQILCKKQEETIIGLTVTAGKDRVKRIFPMQDLGFSYQKISLIVSYLQSPILGEPGIRVFTRVEKLKLSETPHTQDWFNMVYQKFCFAQYLISPFDKQQTTTTRSDVTLLKTYLANSFQKRPLYVSKYQDPSDQHS